MLEHEQNMIALNDHLQMTRLRQQKRFVNPLLYRNKSVIGCVLVLTQVTSSSHCYVHSIANETFIDYSNQLDSHLNWGSS